MNHADYLDRPRRSLTEVANEMRLLRDMYSILGGNDIAEILQGMIDTLEDEMERRSTQC